MSHAFKAIVGVVGWLTFSQIAWAGPCLERLERLPRLGGRVIHQTIARCLNEVTIGRFDAQVAALSKRYERRTQGSSITHFVDTRGMIRFTLLEEQNEIKLRRVIYKGPAPGPGRAILSYHRHTFSSWTTESLSRSSHPDEAFLTVRWQKEGDLFDISYRLGPYDYQNVISYRILSAKDGLAESYTYRLGENWGREQASIHVRGRGEEEESSYWNHSSARLRIAEIVPHPTRPGTPLYRDGASDPVSREAFLELIDEDVLGPIEADGIRRLDEWVSSRIKIDR